MALLKRSKSVKPISKSVPQLEWEPPQEFPSERTSERDNFVCLVKACGDAKDLEEGRRVHECIRNSFYKNNRFLNNLLVDMYGKCGSVVEARWVFAKIEDKNDHSYGIMLKIYVENNLMHDAMRTFMRMPTRSPIAYTSMLTGYALNGALHKAKRLWDRMPDRDVIAWNTMLTMYKENKEVNHAKKLFDAIPQRSHVTWNAMVAAYAQNGYLDDGFRVFVTMPLRNVVAWTVMTVAFSQNSRLEEAEFLFRRMPMRDLISWNAMITGSAHNGCIDRARELFMSMPEQDIFSWNAIVNAYSKSGQLEQAKSLFYTMPDPDPVSWNTMLAAYAQGGKVEEARVLFQMMPDPNTISWNTMISTYADNEFLEEAKLLFDKMPDRNIESWNRMLDGFCVNSSRDEGRVLFDRMPEHNVASSTIIMQAFASSVEHLGFVERVFEGMSDKDLVAWNSLLAAYTQNACFTGARRVFERMSMWNEVSWTISVCCCKQFGHSEELVEELQLVPQKNERFPAASAVLLMAFCQSGHLQDAKKLVEMKQRRDVSHWLALAAAACFASDHHQQKRSLLDENSKKLIFNRLPEIDVVSSTILLLVSLKHQPELLRNEFSSGLSLAILIVYAQTGYLEQASEVFESLALQSGTAWNALISGYSHAGCLSEAGELLQQAPEKNPESYSSLLQACGRFNQVPEGRSLFNSIREQDQCDEIAWNLMVEVLARNGLCKEATEVLQEMELRGVSPDEVSLASIAIQLCSSSSGNGDRNSEGGARRKWFQRMAGEYELAVVDESYACVIDAVIDGAGKEGVDAQQLIESLPRLPTSANWETLVSACSLYLKQSQ